MGHPFWPLFDLVVRTPVLELRYPDDTLLRELATVATGEIHPPETMPFGYPWSDASPHERAVATMQVQWRGRGEWKPTDWHCHMVGVVDGVVVGTQEFGGTEFAKRRTVHSGSWIGMAHQGKGYGTEMRAAMIHLAFEGLGASRCESGAFEDNAASLGVSRKLGYVDNGDEIHDRRDGTGRIVRLLLTRDAWKRRDDITIDGLQPCLELFGAA